MRERNDRLLAVASKSHTHATLTIWTIFSQAYWMRSKILHQLHWTKRQEFRPIGRSTPVG